jgi:O-antigen/teichoic acid export membrane protein
VNLSSVAKGSVTVPPTSVVLSARQPPKCGSLFSWPATMAWSRLRKSPTCLRLASGTAWSLAGAAITRALGLAGSVLAARLLGKTAFGELGILQSTVALFGSLAGFGMGLTATKYVAEWRTRDPVRAGRLLGLCTASSWLAGATMAFGLGLAANWLAQVVLGVPHLAPSLRVGSCLVLLSSVSGTLTGALAGFEAFKRLAALGLITATLGTLLLPLGAWRGGLHGAVWALILTQLLGVWLASATLRVEAARAGVSTRWQEALSEWRTVPRFSLPALLSGVMVGPVTWLAARQVVIQPGGCAEMGLFNAASQWRQLVLFFPALLGSVVLPLLSRLRCDSDQRPRHRLFWFTLALGFLASTAVALPLTIFAPRCMAVFGPAFRAGAPVLMLLTAASVLAATINAVGQVLASQGQMWAGFLLNTIWAAALLETCQLLDVRTAAGLALAHLAAYAVHLVSVGLFLLMRWRGR